MTLRALAAYALFGCMLSASTRSYAVEPAGGAAYPAESEEDKLIGPDAPDASISERSWLGENAPSDSAGALGNSAGGGSGFTLGALIILVGLGGAAIALHLRRRKLSPIPKRESRLDVLSSSRIGPKAYAVTAHVGGRVMLLGVTDHSVTLLTWLDADERESDDSDDEDDDHAPAAADDELPDDYPGSALRQGGNPQPSSPLRESSAPAKSPFASTHDLKRFQEVLRGAIQNKAELPLLRGPFSSPPNAASTLAAQTNDVVFSIAPRRSIEPAPAASIAPAPSSLTSVRPSAAPASLRRKRQRRSDGSAPRPKTKAASAVESAEADFEGQVAGLKSLKGG